MSETTKPISLEQAHDIWLQSFTTMLSVSGLDQNTLAEAMLTVAVTTLMVGSNPIAVAGRLMQISGTIHAMEMKRDRTVN